MRVAASMAVGMEELAGVQRVLMGDELVGEEAKTFGRAEGVVGGGQNVGNLGRRGEKTRGGGGRARRGVGRGASGGVGTVVGR